MVCSLWEAYKAWEDAGAVPKEFKEEDRPVPLAPKNLRKSSDWFRMVPICQHGVITFLHLLELMLGRQPHVRGCIPKSHISLSSSLLPFCGEVKQDKETEVPEPFSLQELGG